MTESTAGFGLQYSVSYISISYFKFLGLYGVPPLHWMGLGAHGQTQGAAAARSGILTQTKEGPGNGRLV
jgi:hypothetical protein